MQSYSLTVDKFLDYAGKWSPNREVVTAAAGGVVERSAYAPLRARSNWMSGALAALDMRLGDRIGTLAWNTLHHLEIYYAAAGLGLVCHTLNPRLSAVQIAEMVNEAQDRVLAVATTLQPLLRQLLPLCPQVQHVVLLDGAAGDEFATGMTNGPRVWAYETLLQTEGRSVPWGDFPEESPAGLCYTSGTTGRPKGVLYTHRSNYLHTLRALQPDVLGLSGRDVLLVAVPMFHANGWGLPFAAAAVGAKLVLPGRHTDGASLAALMRAERVTLAAGVQTVWLGLVDHLDAIGGELPDLKRVIIGGSSCPDALIRRLEARLGAEVQTSWGMTELSPIGAITPPGALPDEARTAGRPPMGLDLKLTDAAGVTLPEQRGVVGHLKAKGPSVLDRYYGAETDALDEEGYFDTGDLASIDADGFVTICGRAKDLIKSGGEWINPAAIEEIVGRHPAVGLVAVIGRPHPKWGERPILIVEARQGDVIEAGELLSMLKGVVAPWQMPDAVIEVEAMPLAATGKIDKIKLRADYAEGEAVEGRSAN